MKYTKEEKEKLKEILPLPPPLQRITALADYLLLNHIDRQLKELEIAHNNNAFREVIILSSIQVETFLKGILVHHDLLKDDADDEMNFYEAINLCYLREFISKEAAINFHECRSLRNQYAHEIFASIGKNVKDLKDEFGKARVWMIEAREAYIKHRTNKQFEHWSI